MNSGNFAPPGNLRLRLSACGSLWTPGTSPLPLLEALSQLYVYWSKNRLISVMVPPRALTDSALRVWPTGTPRAFSTWSFPGVQPHPCSYREPEESYFFGFRSVSDLALQTTVLGNFGVGGFDQACGVTLPDDCRVHDQGYLVLTKMRSGFILPFGPPRTGSQ